MNAGNEGFERFKRIFLMNVERRSRTARGKDEGSKTSSRKLSLLLQGDALKARVALNSEMLADDVWHCSMRCLEQGREIVPSEIRALCERWYDIACKDLIDEEGYEPIFRQLEAAYSRLGETILLNRRYRTWTPGYTVLQIPPAFIDGELGVKLYVWLGLHLVMHPPWRATIGRAALCRILGYVDVMMDGEIHPWIDGCSRVSTALVMWIAALHGPALPLFASKEEHLRTILDIDAHGRYFEACLDRAAVIP